MSVVIYSIAGFAVLLTIFLLMLHFWRAAAIEAVVEYWQACGLKFAVRGRPRFTMGYPAFLTITVEDDGVLYKCQYLLKPWTFRKRRLQNFFWKEVNQRYKIPL